MSKNNSTVLAIVEALRSNAETKSLQFNVLLNMAGEFFKSVSTQSAIGNVFNATVAVPGDNPPAKKYPDRTETTPTPVSVPDAAETETAAQELKTSLPDYGAPKEFLQAIGMTVRSAEKLWETASENQQERDDARNAAIGWADIIRNRIYDL
jgi:hypothetical protein